MCVLELKKHFKVKKLRFSKMINLHESITMSLTNGSAVNRRNFRIPTDPGIYIFFNDLKEIMYIGKTNNLFVRFNNHMGSPGSKVYIAKNIDPNHIKYYSYAICDDISQAELYEMLYSYVWKPKLQYVNKKDIKEFI